MFTEFLKYVTGELKQIGIGILEFLPSLAGAAIVIIITILLAKLLKNLSEKAFRIIGVNVISKRTGIDKIIEPASEGGNLAGLLGVIVYWIVIFIGVVYSLRIIGFEKAQNLIDNVVLYLPNIFTALIIFIIGSYLASFIGDIAAKTAAAAKITYAGSIGVLVKTVIYMIVVMSIIDELTVNLEFLRITTYFTTGGILICLVIVFGISGIGFGKDFLSGIVLRKYLKKSDQIRTKKIRGEIISIDTYCSQISNENKRMIIANSVLLKEVSIYEHREEIDSE